MTEGQTEGGAANRDQGGYDVVVLVPRGDRPEVATRDGVDVFSLPRAAVDGDPDTSSLLAAVARLLGDAHPPPLRIVPLSVVGSRPGLALVELEPLRPRDGAEPPLPDGLTWAMAPADIGSGEPSLVQVHDRPWSSIVLPAMSVDLPFVRSSS